LNPVSSKLKKRTKYHLLIYWVVLAVLPGAAIAQDSVDSLRAQRTFGAQVLLTNSGFGIGAFLSRQTSPVHTFSAEISLSAVKDEREVAFFDRFGQRDVPNKANYLLEFPIQFGLEKRLFRDQIEDNFRPFIYASAGPLLGWLYPYFDDKNGNGVFDDEERSFDVFSGLSSGRFVPGINVSFSIGARFGDPGGTASGVRIGYRLSYYADPIALLEASIKEPTRRIGTPIIVVYFGRMGR
jgi:hypothetical protein